MRRDPPPACAGVLRAGEVTTEDDRSGPEDRQRCPLSAPGRARLTVSAEDGKRLLLRFCGPGELLAGSFSGAPAGR